jgi:phosphohistidine swiveling domain-containing protein
MYLRGEGMNPHERQQASEKRRIETTEMMLKRLKGFKLWVFKKALNWGQSMAEVREDALAEIGLSYPMLRAVLHELGQRFVKAGIIENPADIYLLERDEISTLAEGKEENLISLVAERKAYLERLKGENPPPMIPVKERIMGIKTDVFVPHAADAHTGNILKGVATSAGIVTAPARILHGPEDFDQMHPGDVLVAGTTTPAWTPLFAMASAVVTDIGGPLSHGSIVAREYGIPAVMGTGVATRRIQSGQVITVDGTKGEVILEGGEDEEPAAPIEWPETEKGVTFARGSLAEHTPTPVSPLFATLGLKIANRETSRLWDEIVGAEESREMMSSEGFYVTLNNYVYGGFKLGGKQTWSIMKVMLTQLPLMFRDTLDRWHNARQKLGDVVTEWEDREIATLSSSELLAGVRTVFGAACEYYTVIQATLPAASTSEIVFSRVYKLVKRKTDPEFTTLLFGFETMPVRAEKSLFELAMWLKENPVLADYALRTPTSGLLAALKQDAAPEHLPAESWLELRARLDEHFDQFGRTAYEFDFANPTPAEEPSPQLEAIKLFIEGKAISPYARHQEAVDKREQATESILKRVGWIRKGWFEKSLKWAQETGAIREDSIADMGLGHPLIRRIFAELGQRFTAGNAIETDDDIYWLEEDEVETLIATLEKGEPLPSFADRIPARKARWQAALKIVPPVMLPEKSFWQRFIGGGAPKEKDGKLLLEGLGTSNGQVTAPACVLFSPEDFHKMKPGDVLVATTTTPAWTPLFAMASAVVTDIGGPLSHSSIVAREYGIPAVMAARNATRHIKSGQIITVNGKEGTVVVE